MQKVTVHTAETHLFRLIEASLAGEDVVISRGSVPVVRLVPVQEQPSRIGLLAGQLGPVPGFPEPMRSNALDLREGGGR